MSKTQYHFQS